MNLKAQLTRGLWSKEAHSRPAGNILTEFR